MKEILSKNNWINKMLESMSDAELCTIFEEISDYQHSGILSGEHLRNLEKEFALNVSHTNAGECMRLVENEVLFEMSRRFHNSCILCDQIISSGDKIWYVDTEDGFIEEGTVFSVSYHNGKLETISVDFIDSDFDEFDGSAVGNSLFLSEESAKEKIGRGV